MGLMNITVPQKTSANYFFLDTHWPLMPISVYKINKVKQYAILVIGSWLFVPSSELLNTICLMNFVYFIPTAV